MVKLITVLFVVSVIGGFVFLKFHNTILGMSGMHLPTKAVAGASTSIFSPQVQSSLGLLQKQVAQLSPKDIASSSPQVQAILKTLQSLPAGEAHDVCEKLCGAYLK